MLNELEEEYKKAMKFRFGIDEPPPAYKYICKKLNIDVDKLKKRRSYEGQKCVLATITIILLLTAYPAGSSDWTITAIQLSIHISFLGLLYYWFRSVIIDDIRMSLYTQSRSNSSFYPYFNSSHRVSIYPWDQERAWRILRRQPEPHTDEEKAYNSGMKTMKKSLIIGIAFFTLAHLLAIFTTVQLPITWAMIAYGLAILISVSAYQKAIEKLQTIHYNKSPYVRSHAYAYMHSEEFYKLVLKAFKDEHEAKYKNEYANFLSSVKERNKLICATCPTS